MNRSISKVDLYTACPTEVLDRLTPKQKEVLRFHYNENLSVPEIAVRLGTSRQYVRQTEQAAFIRIRHDLTRRFVNDISALSLDIRFERALYRARIETIQDLENYVRQGGDLESIRNVGELGQQQIMRRLAEFKAREGKNA